MNGNHKKFVLCVGNDIERLFVSQAVKDIDPFIAVLNLSGHREVLQFFEQAKDIGVLPSLIILDMNSQGINSNELAKQLQNDEVFRTVPLVVIDTPSHARSEFAEPGPLVVNPLDYNGLAGTIKELLL
jgi:CheY-like chemotaxis protein